MKLSSVSHIMSCIFVQNQILTDHHKSHEQLFSNVYKLVKFQLFFSNTFLVWMCTFVFNLHEINDKVAVQDDT